ncbi:MULTISPECIES: DUF6221 family protein [unclassified Streptomyces]|uniref:DUF6221 family protein n=1 Tax=unclassified Streptomyces TaxID=2593676 RepID=UPI0036E91368
MSAMDDFRQWLGEQLDHDERIARRAGDSFRQIGETGVIVATEGDRAEECATANWGGIAEHIVEHDPARVLRETDCKRQQLDEHQDVNDGSCGTCVDGQWGYPTHGGSTPQRYPCRTLRLVALPYADRPGYLESWRP